jgi:hypothetical protein
MLRAEEVEVRSEGGVVGANRTAPIAKSGNANDFLADRLSTQAKS